MIVLGVDPAVSPALVVLGPQGDDEKLLLAEHVAIAGKGLRRAERVATHVVDRARLHHVDLVVVEHYAFSNQHTLQVAVELGTLIRYLLLLEGIEYLEVPPTSLKKFVLGKGAGKKDEVRLGAYKHWAFEHPSHDVVDAYVLAKIGRARAGAYELKAYQVDALAKIEAAQLRN